MASVRRVTAPDGLQWEIRTHRVKLPGWRHPQYAELPVAVVRSLFSSNRWIDAEAGFPSNVKIEWRVDKSNATALADDIADRLTRRYENVTPEGARLISMSEPPGTKDL